jgi:uncharacterized membrane protein YfcA
MPNLLCRECAQPVNASANTCPTCGARDPASSCLGSLAALAGFGVVLLLLLYPREFLIPPQAAAGRGQYVGLAVLAAAAVAVVVCGVRRSFKLLAVPTLLLAIAVGVFRFTAPDRPLYVAFAVAVALLVPVSLYGLSTRARNSKAAPSPAKPLAADQPKTPNQPPKGV